MDETLRQELQAALLEMYPDAVNVTWSEKSGYYVADFQASMETVRSASGIVQYSAWFDGGARWQMTETDMPFDMLPEAVLAAFRASEYADWRIDDVDMLLRDGVETIYIIEVEGTNADGIHQDVDLYYSEDGILIRTVVDADDNNDYNDFIPDDPTGGIMDFIRTNYPDARIVEIDVEHGMTEVEIIDGYVCRELLFDSSENWLYTRTELGFMQIPDAILDIFKASEYSDYRIDDVDHYLTPEGEFYRFELDGPGDDLKIDIYADGTIKVVTGDNWGGNGGNGGNGGGNFVGDIADWIEENYPGARIIDRDYDDGYLNIEIWHDGREKDLYFNGSDEWVWTEWDVRVSELPEAVLNAVHAEFQGCHIDDAKFVETPDREFYILELEGWDDDFDIRVTSDGEIF